jgi:hypothetical protein
MNNKLKGVARGSEASNNGLAAAEDGLGPVRRKLLPLKDKLTAVGDGLPPVKGWPATVRVKSGAIGYELAAVRDRLLFFVAHYSGKNRQ